MLLHVTLDDEVKVAGDLLRTHEDDYGGKLAKTLEERQKGDGQEDSHDAHEELSLLLPQIVCHVFKRGLEHGNERVVSELAARSFL